MNEAVSKVDCHVMALIMNALNPAPLNPSEQPNQS